MLQAALEEGAILRQVTGLGGRGHRLRAVTQEAGFAEVELAMSRLAQDRRTVLSLLALNPSHLPTDKAG